MGNRADTAVIGTGPAGLSAAVTLRARNKNVLLFGSENVSGKVSKASEIRNFLGFPEVSGEALAEHFSDHARSMGLSITHERITAVYAMGEYFALQGASGQMYEAASVILATGVRVGKAYPGEEEFLGRGVSYCATCDGALYRGKTVAVIAESSEEAEEVRFLSEVCGKVIFVPLYDCKDSFAANVEIVQDSPVEIKGAFKAGTLVLKNGSVDAECIFILRKSVSPARLVPGLATSDGHIGVDRRMCTNLPGCFACGDAVGAPYQYIKAAGEGNVAALSAVHYLSTIRKGE